MTLDVTDGFVASKIMQSIMHNYKANLQCDDVLRRHVALAAADDVGNLLGEDVEQLGRDSIE